jgi:hypothetical protein
MLFHLHEKTVSGYKNEPCRINFQLYYETEGLVAGWHVAFGPLATPLMVSAGDIQIV